MIRSKLVPALIVLISGVILQPLLGAQQSAPRTLQTVIKSQSKLVLVDVDVTHKHGHPVLKLTQNNFRLYQDGKEQPISSFSAPAENAHNPHMRSYLLLYFDATTVSPSEQEFVGKAAVRFVKELKQPNLYMAAEVYTGVARLIQNFTTHRELMAKAVSNFKFSRAFGTYGEATTENYFETLRDVCRSLGEIPGRKALVLLSGGFALNHMWEDQLAATVRVANRANVTIYPIDTHGLSQGGIQSNSRRQRGGVSFGNRPMGLKNQVGLPRVGGSSRGLGALASRSVTGEEVLRTLAKGTGGFTIMNSNDYLRAFSKVADNLNEYYTLGFVPPVSRQAGLYHRIKVKVQGRGLKVLAREGYYETQPRDMLAGKPAGNALWTDAKSSKRGAIPVSMSAPFFYVGSNKARVDVTLEIPGKALRLHKSKEGLEYRVNVLGVALRPDGSVAKRFSEDLSDSVNKEQKEKLVRYPFDYRSSFEIASGHYRLVMVLSTGGSEFGKATASLDVTPYRGHSLGLSGIALSDRLQPVSPLLASLKGRVLEGKGMLVAGGYQVLPSPTRAFSANGTAAFYVQVYEPALLKSHPPKVGILCKITNLQSHALIYNSGLMAINSQAEAGSSVISVAFKLPMGRLSPGTYNLKVVARDSNGRSSPVRLKKFSVE